MGDRVAVLKDGYLQQVDTPQNLYDQPDNVFVAAFIGSPSMNLFERRVRRHRRGGTVTARLAAAGAGPRIAGRRPALREYDCQHV